MYVLLGIYISDGFKKAVFLDELAFVMLPDGRDSFAYHDKPYFRSISTGGNQI